MTAIMDIDSVHVAWKLLLLRECVYGLLLITVVVILHDIASGICGPRVWIAIGKLSSSRQPN